MPSFDIVSKIDAQTLDNAINNAKKEILNRYDFNDSKSSVELDKKTNALTIITENDMRLKAIVDAIISRFVKQGLDPQSLDLEKPFFSVTGNMIRKEIVIKEGIDKEAAKKIVKKIKDAGLKVQAAIMEDQVRVTAKKIDDLQATIQLCRGENFGQPLQYINMRN
jgi:cyclic-di-GMP-binding protein